MTKLAALPIAVLLWISAATAQTESSRQLFTQIEPILDGLTEITGWKVKKHVPADYISKAKLGEFIEQRVKQAVKPEEIRIESLTLKMFGFIPDGYDLKQSMVELMTEQAAAFYDYDRKRLFITEADTSFLEKRAALVHELAHALADQSFSIHKFLRKGNQSDDAGTAREAVIEGQATWLMWAYSSKLAGGEAKVSEFVLDSMKGAADSAVGSQYPVFEKAPLYLRESLIFPYTSGLQFQDSVIAKLGKAGFGEVFQRPPVSTQQILHPDLYLAHKEPSRLEAPRPPESKRFHSVDQGSVGELDFGILLEQYAGHETAQRIAPHWRGGEYRLYEGKRDKRPLLTFAVEWDSPESAREFFDAYRTLLARKWKKLEIRQQTSTRCAGEGDPGGFELTLDGIKVSSVEGMPEPR
jgi:hypothetical protein